jgi:anthranilate synthase/aminodeoxychorismate synthase-like glutamine amidotransferase
MVLMIDNYDSFTYNIVQYIGAFTKDIEVYKNDEITIEQIRKLDPERIVISPGPSWPENAGISKAVITSFMAEKPILGVCLGHQCMVEALGGKIIRNKVIMHGKTSEIHHDGKGVYAGVKNPFNATRYHSLVAEPSKLPDELTVSAWTKDDEIMGVRHKKYKMEGVQYHPESILTEEGMKIIENFLSW